VALAGGTGFPAVLAVFIRPSRDGGPQLKGLKFRTLMVITLFGFRLRNPLRVIFLNAVTAILGKVKGRHYGASSGAVSRVAA
jgi:hypothetical protein